MTLYMQETGPAKAPTLLFLHGGGGAGWMWQAQLEHFADYHCLLPDLPEHGQSGQVQPFGIQHSAALLAELIRTRAHGGSAHVIGLSLGAQIGVALLALAPECVERAMISSALLRPMPGASLLSPWLMALTYYSTVAPFKHSEWWIRLNMKYAAGVPSQYYPQFCQNFRGLTAAGFSHVMLENLRFRLPASLARVRTPTLVVVGQNEPAVMQQSARDLAAALPQAQAYAVHHTPPMRAVEAHNWGLTAPALFAQTVRSWVTDRPLPAALHRLIV